MGNHFTCGMTLNVKSSSPGMILLVGSVRPRPWDISGYALE